MSRFPALFLLAALFLSSGVNAFTTQPGRSIQGTQQLQSSEASKRMLTTILKMAEGNSDQDAASKISADGTFYDDEVSSHHLFLHWTSKS